MYLADKSGKLYNQKDRLLINQWLMAQMGTVGPMIGQHHQFHHYNPGKSEFGEERYFKITKRIYGELDTRLKATKFLAGSDYTIADIATWPWMARHEWHDIGLKNYKNFKIENYKYAQLHKDVKSESLLRDIDFSKLLDNTKNITSSISNPFDLTTNLNLWNYNNEDSFFRVSSLVKRETKSVNLDTLDDRNLFLDISQTE